MSEKHVDLNGWPSLVPELFFDIIARVLPGCYLVLGLASIFYDGQSALGRFAKTDAVPATLIFVAIVAAGYSLALVLCRASDLVTNLFHHHNWKRVAKHHEVLLRSRFLGAKWVTDEFLNKKSIAGYSKAECDSMCRFIQESLKESDRSTRLVLAKMEAEYFFCSNFAASSILLFIIAILKNKSNLASWWPLLIVAIFAWSANVYLGRRLFERQFALLSLRCKTRDQALANAENDH